MKSALVLAHEERPGLEAAPLGYGRDHNSGPGALPSPLALAPDLLQKPHRLAIESALGIGLELVGDDAQQQRPRC